jgi:REP element-mobilizing transposase RayT
MKRSKQLLLDLRTHGGKRRGAGRKPKGDKPLVSHAARPEFHRPTPVHVTLKVARDVPNLRSSRRFREITRCFAASRGLHGLRLVDFSVLSNHLHLVVEADSKRSLSRGVQGLSVRLARSLNQLFGRRGKLFADHHHSRLLKTPTEVANAIGYVRNNANHHYGERGADPFSSAHGDARAVLAEAVGWLLRTGWRRAYSTAAATGVLWPVRLRPLLWPVMRQCVSTSP